MNDIDYAHVLLKLAKDDLKALTYMKDPEAITEAIFGFHAQQAVEKGLKAWLSSLKVLFPLTHEIKRLLSLLEQQGVDVEDLRKWVTLTPFAVDYRYGVHDCETLDRTEMIDQLTMLLQDIQSKIPKNTS